MKREVENARCFFLVVVNPQRIINDELLLTETAGSSILIRQQHELQRPIHAHSTDTAALRCQYQVTARTGVTNN